MSKYIQRVVLGGGKVRWVGWEIDGVGTEIPGLILADSIDEEDIASLGVKHYVPMAFEDFLGISAQLAPKPQKLDDQDIEYRLDALRVGLDRLFDRALRDVSKVAIKAMFSGVSLADPRIQARLLEWEGEGAVQILGTEECYLRIVRRL
ncbi:MAG: hypothetical protein ACSLFQ_00050 [Thermoanaerobaculia bacterium]